MGYQYQGAANTPQRSSGESPEVLLVVDQSRWAYLVTMLHGAGIFTYIWVIFRGNVGKYSIHGAYGLINFIHLTRLWIHITSIKSHLYQIVCFGDGVNAAGLPWSAAGRTNKAREHFGHAICYQCYRVKLNCWSNLHWHFSTQNTFWLHLLQTKSRRTWIFQGLLSIGSWIPGPQNHLVQG